LAADEAQVEADANKGSKYLKKFKFEIFVIGTCKCDDKYSILD